MNKTLLWISIFIFSTIGGLLPSLWGDTFLSMTSIQLSTIGGLFGIWVAYKASQLF